MTKKDAKHIFPPWETVRASVPLLITFLFFMTSFSVLAHEVRPAYLELKDRPEYDVFLEVPRAGNMRPGIYVEFYLPLHHDALNVVCQRLD